MDSERSMYGITFYKKNGTKHDVCVKRPSLFPASATTYDNSQSGLSATRVQGAIDEIADNASDALSRLNGEVLKTVNGDGVKSFATLYSELATELDNITLNSKLKQGNEIFVLTKKESDNAVFGSVQMGASNVSVRTIKIAASDAKYYIDTLSGTSSSFSDVSATPLGSAYSITLYK